jgi:hypothetical protein
MFRKCLIVLYFFLFTYSYSQSNFTLSGYIVDQSSKEVIIGSNVIIPLLNTGTISNSYGFYSITVPEGNYEVIFSILGYKEIVKNINIDKNISIDIMLNEEIEELKEVVITENIEDIKIDLPVLSLNRLSGQTIRQTPVVFGESDLLKTIQLLPGVSNAGEGASGFNVRGGGADQNLILFDEAIIYNSSHLFGLFSVFNSDAIKEVKLFKGGIPASYGGRVSSVLDVYQKDGNKNELKFNGGIGVISSRFLIEGPIQKEKSSFLIASRGTYAHLFLKLSDINNSAYFFDINTKSNFIIDKKNKIYFSGYFGRDFFKLDNTFLLLYGNTTFNLRWNHLINDKTFSNTSVIYSDYYYGLQLDFVGFDWNSGIKNFNLKFDLKNYYSSKIQFNYGTNIIYYDFNPGKIMPLNDKSGINRSNLNKKFAFENSAYFDVIHKINNKISLRYGLRFNQFIRLKQTGLKTYLNNNPVIYDSVLEIYNGAEPLANNFDSKNNIFKIFNNLEPRFNLSYNRTKSSFKFSYNRLNQYIHLISNTNSPQPLDIWTPSGPYIEPQKLDQFAIGYYKNIDIFKFESEIFYKKIKNRLDYIDGADLVANNDIERTLLRGKARAYGVELLLKKNTGRNKFWISYTLSKSEQKTSGISNNESGINYGEWYLTPYDKTHDISINSKFKINEKLTLNGNFIYQTGQPTNYPNAQYQYMNLSVPNYGLRNTNRLPNYHRLDLSLSLLPKKNINKRVNSEWVFGIYNLYDRDNASSILFRKNNESLKNEAVQISIFGIVPSITYNFKF